MTGLHSRPGGKPEPETAEACLDARFRKARLRPDEASAYLLEMHGVRVAISTLAKWRCLKSDGPAFQSAGRAILYRRDTLDEWVDTYLGAERCSTSQTSNR